MPSIQASGYSPTIKKRALSRKLVELREQCGMTTSEVCKRLRWSPSKLNYIEKAKWVDPNSDSVADLCELYGVGPSDTEALIKLTREARQRGWWRKYNDVFRDDYVGLEAGASEIFTFQTTLIPGLLQTPGYIEAVTRLAGIQDDAEIRRHVAARTQRQEIISRKSAPCRFHALIDENALVRIKDTAVRSEQIRHLINASTRPNVDIQLLLLVDGLYPGTSEPFSYLKFPEPSERDIVFLETTIDDRMMEEEDELERYLTRFHRLRDAAQSTVATGAYLARLIE
ncbi:helix-turn-helix domain-containing protein [Actinomadura geliboluensis]|uniref:helix-turn-helix domain-containing protein n=1 Tax=Actinomadura geliboluensis TaxID=882440 RepID=UPI0037164E23